MREPSSDSPGVLTLGGDSEVVPTEHEEEELP
jgi:hypothetical protein